jgi:hypothetical protein
MYIVYTYKCIVLANPGFKALTLLIFIILCLTVQHSSAAGLRDKLERLPSVLDT